MYTVTVITDALCKNRDSTATRIGVGAATYRGTSNTWLSQVGHRKTVYFATGQSYESSLNESFLHLIASDKIPSWTLMILDRSKMFIEEFLKPGEWNAQRLQDEASQSHAVVMYLRFEDVESVFLFGAGDIC